MKHFEYWRKIAADNAADLGTHLDYNDYDVDDFVIGDIVCYVPIHQRENENTDIWERGVVTSTNSIYVFVSFNDKPSQACKPIDLLKIIA